MSEYSDVDLEFEIQKEMQSCRNKMKALKKLRKQQNHVHKLMYKQFKPSMDGMDIAYVVVLVLFFPITLPLLIVSRTGCDSL